MLSWLVFTIFVRILMIWSISFKYSDTSKWDRFASFINRNQYLVSLASFEAIAIFEMKSFLDWPAPASATLAPMLVEERRSWFANIYSLFSLKSFTNLIIRKENWKLLSSINTQHLELKNWWKLSFLFQFAHYVHQYTYTFHRKCVVHRGTVAPYGTVPVDTAYPGFLAHVIEYIL